MNVFEEINCNLNNISSSFRCTLIDGKSLYFEGVKKIISFDVSQIEFLTKSVKLIVNGKGLKIKKYVGGDVLIVGEIFKVSVENG